MNESSNNPNEQPESVEQEKQPIIDTDHLIEPVNEPEQAKPAETTAVSTPPPQPAPQKAQNSGGVLVLQWLTYAFWFWFSVSASWLAGVVINFFVSGGTSSYEWGSVLAYPLASVIIMLIIALVTDFFYAKHEPEKKTGGANVIMLLHVVPFVLMAIGALVTIVFAFIGMLLNSDPIASTDGPLQVMLVSLVVVVLLGLAAARAFFGSKPRVRLIARIGMIVIALGFIIAGIAGPAVEAVRTKDDRLIERALPSLSSDIREYVQDNNKLPATLSDVTHNSSYSADAVQLVIDSGLVKYKANTLPAADGNSYNPGDALDYASGSKSGVSLDSPLRSISGANRFYYQLCTTYKTEKKDRYNYSERNTYTKGDSVGVAANYRYDYVTSISSHPAGSVCYNLYADSGYGSIMPMDATE